MLIDFGIAKQAADGAQTRALARAATHGFSPPEQAMGTGTDPRSDVYALAATFYALVAGVVPTPAHERVAGVDLADPTTLVPELPASMGAALMQALNLNINRRPASIEAFLHAMGLMATPAEETAATSRTVLVGDLGGGRETGPASVRIRSEHLTVAPAAPPVRRRSRAGMWVAVGVMALAAAIGGAWLLHQPDTPATQVAKPAPTASPARGTVTTSPSRPEARSNPTGNPPPQPPTDSPPSTAATPSDEASTTAQLAKPPAATETASSPLHEATRAFPTSRADEPGTKPASPAGDTASAAPAEQPSQQASATFETARANADSKRLRRCLIRLQLSESRRKRRVRHLSLQTSHKLRNPTSF